jgi:hypothetical protein
LINFTFKYFVFVWFHAATRNKVGEYWNKSPQLMPFKMGNQYTTLSTMESSSYQIIKYVPILGSVYSVPRLVVGAVTGDKDVVLNSATGLGGNILETGMVFGAVLFGPATLGAAIVVEMAAGAGSAMLWKAAETVEDKIAESIKVEQEPRETLVPKVQPVQYSTKTSHLGDQM